MPVSLSNLPSTFALNIEDKKFFPHLFNRRENLLLRLPHLPPKEDYLCDNMKPNVRAEFLRWYEQNAGTEFVLSEQLAAYCLNDVKILLW